MGLTPVYRTGSVRSKTQSIKAKQLFPEVRMLKKLGSSQENQSTIKSWETDHYNQ